MKKLAAILVLLPLIAFNQTEGYKISAYSIYGLKEDCQDQNFNTTDFLNHAKEPSIFVYDDSLLSPRQDNYGFHRYGFGTELAFQHSQAKHKIIVGLNVSTGTNHQVLYRKMKEHVIDTVEFILPPTTMTYDGEVYYTAGLDTMFLDSINIQEETVMSRTTNVLGSMQFLKEFKNDNFSLSFGLGIEVGVSLIHQISTNYRELVTMRLVDNAPERPYQMYWQADFPSYNPASGSTSDLHFNVISSTSQKSSGKLIGYFKPFVPLRLEIYIADEGFFSRFGLVGTALGGLEFQAMRGARINSRFFWSYRAGFTYRL